MEITYGRGSVYSIQYHSVWCVKYRQKIISDDYHWNNGKLHLWRWR